MFWSLGPGTPASAQENPSPALLITIQGPGEHGEHSLAIADPNTGKIVDRIPINGVPHQVAASSDGKLAFITDSSFGKHLDQYPDDSIDVIDLASRKVLRKVELGQGAFPHAITFAGKRAYFTLEGDKVVAGYNPATALIDWMEGIGHRGGHALAVSRDAKKLFLPSLDPNTVSAVEIWDSPPPPPYPEYTGSLDGPGPYWRITSIPVGIGPEGIALSPDGKEVWVLTRGDSAISIIDVATRKVSQTIALKPHEDPHSIAFTPDGKQAVMCDSVGDVVIFDTAARKEIKRVNVDNAPGVADKRKGTKTDSVLIAPDASRAFVTVSGSNYVAILDLKSLELSGSISTGDAPEGMAWVSGKSEQK
jgi:YVTN family beta-propeller protein